MVLVMTVNPGLRRAGLHRHDGAQDRARSARWSSTAATTATSRSTAASARDRRGRRRRRRQRARRRLRPVPRPARPRARRDRAARARRRHPHPRPPRSREPRCPTSSTRPRTWPRTSPTRPATRSTEHSDKIDDGIDKAAEFVDDKTKGKYADKIDTVQAKAHDVVDRHHAPTRATAARPVGRAPVGRLAAGLGRRRGCQPEPRRQRRFTTTTLPLPTSPRRTMTSSMMP